MLDYCPALEGEGYHITCLPVDRDGLLKLGDLENAITPDTAVVSLMWANNETGVLFPVREIAECCRSRGVLFHCDAVQAAGKVEMDVRQLPADYLSLTVDQEGICASSGSACLADSDEPSHVVKAMKPDTGASRQTIRFSLGAGNTLAGVQTGVESVKRAVLALRP